MLVKTCDHRTALSAPLQPPYHRSFVKCLEMLTNSQFILCCAFAGDIFHFHRLSPIDLRFCFGGALHLTGECPPVVCACGRPQLTDSCDDAAPEFWCSVSVGINCRACCSIPSDISNQDFKFPSCCDGTCTSLTEVPADSKTSIPVSVPIFTCSLRIACNLLGNSFS